MKIIKSLKYIFKINRFNLKTNNIINEKRKFFYYK